MKYDLAMPQAEFLDADRVVRAMLLGASVEPYSLRLATSDSSCLHPDSRSTLEGSKESVGHCFENPSNKTFDIWVSPHYRDTTTDAYKDTILHELSHGYLNNYKHNHRFKRFFGRVLHHYSDLVSPLDLDTLVPNMLKEYTKQGAGENTKKFWERLEMEQDAIAKIAVQERSKIELCYLSMSNREKARERAK